MPPPYDAVVSIGGQSFMDGIWRLLGPALEGLSNPLPIAIPGFVNAQMRVTQLVPVFPGSPPPTGALLLRANVELTGEALLHVIVESGTASIALAPQSLSLANLAGPIALPAQAGTLSNIAIGGTVGTLAATLSGGTGDVALPAGTATLAGGTGDGTLTPTSNLTVPGIPLPAVVPVAVDLTDPAPLALEATVPLTVAAPSAATRFGLLFTVGDVNVPAPAWPPATFPAALETTLQAAVSQIVEQLSLQLGVPPLTTPAVNAGTVADLIAPIPGLVATALDNALSNLLAETGRLVFSPAGTGGSCDARVLPTSADAVLSVATDGSYVLQVGFKQASSSDITATLPIPTGAAECEVLVGNSFALGLLCCLVERLPAFNLPVAATTGTVDVAGATHVRCCNFTGVTANFGGVAIGGGGISVCIDGPSGGTKSFSLVGSFAQTTGLTFPLFGITVSLGSISVAAAFNLPLAFDLQDATSLANLRMFGTPTITATVTPNMTGAAILVFILAILVPIAAILTGLLAPLGALLGAVMASVVVLIVLILVNIASAAASTLLGNAVRTLLSGASLLRSPVALPPGLFEAFGKFAPATVTIDDLEAAGVLHTPTSVWGLLPRLGSRRYALPNLVTLIPQGPDLTGLVLLGSAPAVLDGLAQPGGSPGAAQPGGSSAATSRSTNRTRSKRAPRRSDANHEDQSDTPAADGDRPN